MCIYSLNIDNIRHITSVSLNIDNIRHIMGVSLDIDNIGHNILNTSKLSISEHNHAVGMTNRLGLEEFSKHHIDKKIPPKIC